jgi:hypothetical protein
MNGFRQLVGVLAVAGVGSLLPVQEANAGLVYAALGSGVCRATDGKDTNLYYNPYSVRNNSGVNQYITCHVPFIRENLLGLLPGAGYGLTMRFGSTSPTARNVTCTAYVVNSGVVSLATQTVAVSSISPGGQMDFTPLELQATSDKASLSVKCLLAPDTYLSLFYAVQPETNLLIP